MDRRWEYKKLLSRGQSCCRLLEQRVLTLSVAESKHCWEKALGTGFQGL